MLTAYQILSADGRSASEAIRFLFRNYHSTAYLDGALPNAAHLVLAVRYVDQSKTKLCVQTQNLPAKFILQFIIEVRQWFVHQQRNGLRHQ